MYSKGQEGYRESCHPRKCVENGFNSKSWVCLKCWSKSSARSIIKPRPICSDESGERAALHVVIPIAREPKNSAAAAAAARYTVRKAKPAELDGWLDKTHARSLARSVQPEM